MHCAPFKRKIYFILYFFQPFYYLGWVMIGLFLNPLFSLYAVGTNFDRTSWRIKTLRYRNNSLVQVLSKFANMQESIRYHTLHRIQTQNTFRKTINTWNQITLHSGAIFRRWIMQDSASHILYINHIKSEDAFNIYFLQNQHWALLLNAVWAIHHLTNENLDLMVL